MADKPIYVSQELHSDLKVIAAGKGITLRDLIEPTLNRLAKREKPNETKR